MQERIHFPPAGSLQTFGPSRVIWYFWIGLVHLLQSHTAEAIPWLEKARLATPQFHAWPASAYALKGDTERATDELAEARKLCGDGRCASIAR